MIHFTPEEHTGILSGGIAPTYTLCNFLPFNSQIPKSLSKLGSNVVDQYERISKYLSNQSFAKSKNARISFLHYLYIQHPSCVSPNRAIYIQTLRNSYAATIPNFIVSAAITPHITHISFKKFVSTFSETRQVLNANTIQTVLHMYSYPCPNKDQVP